MKDYPYSDSYMPAWHTLLIESIVDDDILVRAYMKVKNKK